MWPQPEQTPWMFDSRMQTEARHRLIHLIEQGEPIGFLEGSHGSGKSTLLRQLRRSLNRQGCAAMLISTAALDEPSLLRHIAAGLSVLTADETSCGASLQLLQDELAGRAACGHQTVILLDDVELASEDVSGAILGLIAMAQRHVGSLAIIAATGQPLSGALQRLSTLPVRLTAFEADESRQFLQRMLVPQQAASSPFDDSAIEAAAAVGDGSPARLIRICDALKAVQSAHPGLTISAEVVEETARELLPRRAG